MINEKGLSLSGKEEKALRVFGEAVVDESDSSLSYSVSPQKNLSNNLTFDSACESNNKEISLVEENDDSRNNIIGSDLSHNFVEKENKVSLSFQNSSPNKTMRERVRNMRMLSRSPLRRDLVKKTQDAINKAALSISNVNKSVVAAQNAKSSYHDQKRQVVSKVRQNWKEGTAEAKTLTELAEQNRREFLALQRQLSSKFSKEKARRHQMQRLEKLNRIEKEIHFKSDVFRDHQTKLRKEEDDRRRHSTAVRARIRSNHRMGAQKLKLAQIKEEQAIFEERHAASVALRNTLQQSASQRRQSFAFRNGDARRIRQLHAIMEEERLQQEHKSFELNWQAEKDAEKYNREMELARRESLALRNAVSRTQRQMVSEAQQRALTAEHASYELKWAAEKDAEAYVRSQQEERRQSLMQRNQDGKRQREFLQQLHSDTILKDHASFELKWAGERDAKSYENEQEKARRESLALRNKEGRRLRDFEIQEHNSKVLQEHESYELKWDGEKDAEAYKRKMESERRKSLAQRNSDARRIRAELQLNKAEKLSQDQKSYELKRAAEKDAEQYLRQQEALRRESLQFRNKERLQHAKLLEELRILALEKETESYVLKWAGDNDAKAYIAKLEEERRQSLQLRGKQTMHHRKVENEQHQDYVRQLHEDEVLRAVDQREYEQYAKQSAERDRKSFEFRRKDARLNRIQDKESSEQRKEIEDQNLALEALARKDVLAYVDDCKRRKRMSLACRAKEKRHHAKWMLQQKERKQDELSRRVHDQLIDQKYVELALQKERARLALNAIRHAGYSFNTFFEGKS